MKSDLKFLNPKTAIFTSIFPPNLHTQLSMQLEISKLPIKTIKIKFNGAAVFEMQHAIS